MLPDQVGKRSKLLISQTVIRFRPEKKDKKRILFLKNEPGKLLKIKDKTKKRTGNEAETKLPNLLKIKKEPKKRTENEPENKAGHIVENKGSLKNEPETNRKARLKPSAALFAPD